MLQNDDAALVADKFHEIHARYQEKSITHRRFKQRDILPLIEKLKSNPAFTVSKIGKSVEGRDIYLIKVGTGKTKVMLWSQMHGDEPTATMAMLDIFNFLGAKDNLDAERTNLLVNTTLYFIPMLNPDGAEVYTRRNALDVDLNRDAVRLQSPEAQLLKKMRDTIKPAFGFNLHDQNPRYTVGRSNKPATISFLAPPYNYEKSVNKVRGNAMRLIVLLHRVLQQYIPGQVAKYSDDFEPRAFGDNIQKWGTSVVLIESGGYRNDPEKQYIRKLNFTAILAGLQAIASQSYEAEKLDAYYDIPENARYLFDLVVRHAQVEKSGQLFHTTDVGINRIEIGFRKREGFYFRSAIDEIGDMSMYYGYEEVDATGMQLVPGKVYPETIQNLEALKAMDLHALLQQGYTTVRLKRYEPAEMVTSLPVQILTGQKIPNYELGLAGNPTFTLQKEGQTHYAIVNGFVYDVIHRKNGVKNSLVE